MPVGRPLIMEFIEFLAAGEQNRFLAPPGGPFTFEEHCMSLSLDEKCVCNRDQLTYFPKGTFLARGTAE